MYCHYCGNCIAPNTIFCGSCGAAIVVDNPVNVTPNNPYAYNGYYEDPNVPTIPGFLGAFGVCMKKFFSGYGRASRSEFWFFILWLVLIYFGLCFLIGGSIGGYMGERGESLESIIETTGRAGNALRLGLLIAFFFPTATVMIRRLHDSNRSGANLLWLLLPFVGAIVLLVFWATAPSPGPNRYGAQPTIRL